MSSETCVWLTQPVGPDHGLRLLLSNVKGHAMSLYCCLTSALSAILLPNLSFRLRSMVNPFERIVQMTALTNVISRGSVLRLVATKFSQYSYP